MKVVTAIPRFLIEVAAKIAQAIGNAGVSMLNAVSNVFSSRKVEAVQQASEESIDNEPILVESTVTDASEENEAVVDSPVFGLEKSEHVEETAEAPKKEEFVLKNDENTLLLIEDESSEGDQLHVQYPAPTLTKETNYVPGVKTALGAIAAVTALAATYLTYAAYFVDPQSTGGVNL